MTEQSESSVSQMDRNQNTFSGLFFMLFIFSIVSLISYVIFIDTNDLNWQPVKCQVLEVSAGKPYTNSKGISFCSVSVKYEYEFSGKKYTSERIDSCGLSLRTSDSQPSAHGGDYQLYSSPVCFAKNQSVGSTATCYVNPKKPELAVLFKGSSRIMFYIFSVSAILAVVTLTALIIATRKMSRA
ncbi:MAG: DUF3592 domain-containing protein [Candidatus Xenobiia bacterium LiM19]